MEPSQLQRLHDYLHKPQGLILVTGPTGAGKSITLYAALKVLLQPQRNVMSVEDPVEMVVPGMHQVAIHEAIGLTFARVLRALLRQDPDVIMLGELRDADSADVAIKAAQTGHLLLTSMHTSSAAEAITRCHGLQVDVLGLIYCLNLVITQRLLRRLCEHCKLPLSAAQLETCRTLAQHVIGTVDNVSFNALAPAQAQGCDHCHGGYHGRLGVFSLWSLTDSQRQSVAAGKVPDLSAEEDLWQQGMLQVLAGNTTIDELRRVLV
jgi:type II secretory ATPase GspE/PulE/Tfp pilus assembly ATPase PilB-like protein